jgi:hypothetical protein
VERHANAGISQHNLELILYFLGINGSELNELHEISKTVPGPHWKASS